MLSLKRRTRKGSATAYYYIWGQGPDGVFYRESLKTDRRAEAEQRFEKRRKEINAHAERVGGGDDLPIADLIAFYLDNPGEAEQERDDRFLDKVAIAVGEDRVSSHTSTTLRDIAVKAYPNAKAQTINRQFVAPLSAVINFCSERGLCPPLRIKRFKESKPAIKKAVSPEWIERFCSAALELDLHAYAALELFMATSGARRGSCLDLEWLNVHLDSRHADLLDTKTGHAERAILTAATERMLALMQPSPATGLVFGIQLDRFGKPPRSFYRNWKKICDKAGIDYIPPHQAGRHTFATELIVTHRIDAFTTARLGGWKSTKMLEKYVHAQQGREVVDASFGSVGTSIAPLPHQTGEKPENTG